MIIIKIEMWPKGDHTKARSLGVATIVNVGGSLENGDYHCRLFKGPEYSTHAETRPLEQMLSRPTAIETWKRGEVRGFPRRKLGPWDLLYLALRNMVGGRNP